jgi:hypothetical protein
VSINSGKGQTVIFIFLVYLLKALVGERVEFDGERKFYWKVKKFFLSGNLSGKEKGTPYEG